MESSAFFCTYKYLWILRYGPMQLSSSDCLLSHSNLPLIASTVDFAEHDVERADDGDDVGQEVVLADLLQGGEMGKAGRLDLAPVRAGAAVCHQVDAELPLGRFDGCVRRAGRHLVALREQLEVMDERLHRRLKLKINVVGTFVERHTFFLDSNDYKRWN